jgi:hypothetical protein
MNEPEKQDEVLQFSLIPSLEKIDPIFLMEKMENESFLYQINA